VDLLLYQLPVAAFVVTNRLRTIIFRRMVELFRICAVSVVENPMRKLLCLFLSFCQPWCPSTTCASFPRLEFQRVYLPGGRRVNLIAAICRPGKNRLHARGPISKLPSSMLKSTSLQETGPRTLHGAAVPLSVSAASRKLSNSRSICATGQSYIPFEQSWPSTMRAPA